LTTIARAENLGWKWIWINGRRGLQSPRGKIYEVRMRPLSARRLG
jgi:hypothetical protein